MREIQKNKWLGFLNKQINEEELFQILKDWREKWTKRNVGLCFLIQTNQP